MSLELIRTVAHQVIYALGGSQAIVQLAGRDPFRDEAELVLSFTGFLLELLEDEFGFPDRGAEHREAIISNWDLQVGERLKLFRG